MGKYWVGTGKNRHRTAAGIRHEHEQFQSSPEAKKANSARVSARKKAIRKGIVHKGDGRELDHIKGLADGGSNSSSNIRVVSRTYNRSRKQASRKRGSKRKGWRQ